MLPEQMATVSQFSLINFLKKHETNRQIGQSMLGDSNAMKKDVLGPYAPEVLKQLCPFYIKTDLLNHSMFKTNLAGRKNEKGNDLTEQLKN
jgi:hypothetical protein